MQHHSIEELLASLEETPPQVSSTEVLVVAAAFGLSGQITALGGERDRNYLVAGNSGRWLLKVANRAEPDELLSLQNQALRHIETVAPELLVPRVRRTEDGADWTHLTTSAGEILRVRALSYLSGTLLDKIPYDRRLMHSLGQLAARLDRALGSFFHSAADHALAWDVKNAHRFVYLLDDVPTRHAELAQRILRRFEQRVVPVMPGLRHQIIHNDIACHNTIVDPGDPIEVAGIYDFGDMVFAPLIQELATAASDAVVGRADPIAASTAIVAGFHARLPLCGEELALLPDFVAARLALGCALGVVKRHSDERSIHTDWSDNASAMLEALEAAGAARIESLYRAACGFGLVHAMPVAADQCRLFERRKRVVANGGYHSYDIPVHMVRGDGAWLYDAEGRAYLDAYNNVAHVGHCHPAVVHAIAEQSAVLNTNTRYLYDSIVAYAEAITATLPSGLDVCVFVSSGSEANDLAWRMAKTYTGHDGALVMTRAYHGVTDAMHDLSPYDVPENRPLATHVETLLPPDEYRGRWGPEVPDRGELFAVSADQAIEQLRAKGHQPAAFFIDTILSSNGIIVPAPGFMKGVYERVHRAGGLFVADEVQAGFGRLGDHLWGFQFDDFQPDIVTFGKPIGNGHPLGLVVTTRDIADHFIDTSSFFSTTGGNPVSCRAAHAVLEVMQREKLQQNARLKGEQIAAGVRALANKHAIIGDVRGRGLFLGIELVRDRETKLPAARETATVINSMKDRGVLIGREGEHDNVLKMRPSMVFNHNHVSLLLDTLDDVLGAL